MEEEHRRIIKENIDKLVLKTELNQLMKCCVQCSIISPIMRENLHKKYPDKTECHRQLFIKITKRGPKAFKLLLEILKNEFPAAEKVLYREDSISIHENKIMEGYRSRDDEKLSPKIEQSRQVNETDSYDDYNPIEEREPPKLEIYTKPTKHDASIVVEKSQKIHYDERVDTYPMRSNYRGVFLLVNIITFPAAKKRRGAEIDRENLIHLFREFGYDVFYYENLRFDEFKDILKQLLNSNYTRRTESFVMAILTHGTMEDGKELIEFHDGVDMNLADIVDNFSNKNCPNLLGKPKIFIFPFCRGSISDRGTYGELNRKYAQTDGISRTINSPTLSDIIIFYASVPGYKTHRDPDTGSWYVQMMCKVWAKHAHNTDVETLEKKVGEETGKIRSDHRLQTSSRVTFGFNKALYFNPGFCHETAK